MNAPTEKMPNPIAVVRQQLDAMKDQFMAALPAHIPVERFARVVMTAIQNTPDLVECERRSLWNSCMKAAQDGLLPDGREAALVIYKDRNRGKIAQYMPMIAGLRKKVRNSGEIATWDAQVVYERDEFAFELGDEPYIRHKPELVDDRGRIIAAYSIATLKSGEKSREVMSIREIEGIRGRSKAKESGPWVTDYAEMCRKTVARRHSKVLPMSTDLDDLIRRDDDLYDLQAARDEAQQDRPKSLAGRLDMLASLPADGPTIEVDATGSRSDESNTGGEDVTDSDGHDAPKASRVENGGAPVDGIEKPDEAGGADQFDPDRFLDDIEARFAAATDSDQVAELWAAHVEPRLDDGSLFPPDIERVKADYARALARFEE